MERRRKHSGHSSPQNTCRRINIYNRQSNLKLHVPSVRNVISFFFQHKHISCDEVSVYFVGKRKISTLHEKYFQNPSPTDCITFPLDDHFLGEIFICPQMALKHNPKKPYNEVTLYIFHCLLHLLGYDDIDNRKRAIMRREEKRLMALARKHRCILETSS